MSKRKQLNLFETPQVTVDPIGTVILLVQRTRFGIERKVNMQGIEVRADKNLLSLNAKIMDSPEMKSLIGLDSNITREISRLALPSIFRFGAYVVPVTLMRTLDAKLEDYKERRELLSKEVVRRAEQRIEEAKLALGELAKEIKWPTTFQVEAMFTLKWRFVSIGLPAALKAVDEQMYEKERVKIQADLEQSRDVIEMALVKGFQEFNGWLVERLTPDPESKRKKTVKASALNRFKNFLTFLPIRNVTGMTDVDELAAKARLILEGVEGKDLVKSEGLADAVRSQFTTIRTDLDAFIEERKDRIITFDEQEAEAL